MRARGRSRQRMARGPFLHSLGDICRRFAKLRGRHRQTGWLLGQARRKLRASAQVQRSNALLMAICGRC